MKVGVNHWAGVTTQFFADRDLPFLKEAGISILRLSFSVEYADNLATLIPAVRASGIEILGILGGEDLIGNIDAWGDWVYNTVLKYKNLIKVWEIWNEPDWGTGFQDDPEGYTEFLKRAYTRAKEADPTCYILAGALTGAMEGGPLDYFKRMYSAGAKNYFDAFSIHCYPEGPPEYPNVGSWGQAFWKIPLFKDLMDEKGDGHKKIWLTEFGWSTENVSEEEQADYLVRALVMAKSFGWVETAIVFNWMDSEDANLYYGLTWELYDPPYTHENFCKPSLFAVKDFITPTPIPPILPIIVGAGLGYAVGRETGAAVGALAGATLGSVSFKYRERLTRIGMLGRR